MTAKAPTKAALRAAEIEANKQNAFVKKVRSLLGHVSGHTLGSAILAAYKSGVSADAYAAAVAAQEPVGKAVHALKADAVNNAERQARDTVERVTAELEAAGWDINTAAPYPTRNLTRWERDRAKAKYSLFHAIVETRTGHRSSYGHGEPYFVQIAEQRVERFVDNARQIAAFNYDAFIVKLVAKIGEGAVDATLNGNHVWGHSILTVAKEDGTTERWKTQQITNYTKDGHAYAQWPTRKLK